jgi:hypothetical protein
MAATIATLQDALKEYYLPFAEQLNQEILVYDMFSKQEVTWSGRDAILPVHVSRNTGVSFIDDGQALPTAGEQGWERLVINAKFLVGKFQLSGPAIAAAKKGGAGSLVDYMTGEVDRTMDDVHNAANETAIVGGEVLGYIWEKAVIAPAANTEYSGRTTKVFAAAGAFVRAIRLDTYAEVDPDLTRVLNGVSSTSISFSTQLDTSTVPAGVVIAIVAYQPVAVDSNVIGATAPGPGTIGQYRREMTGINSNLASQSHFGVNRSLAANAALRSNFLLVDPVNNVYASLTLDRMQACFDEINLASGGEPDMLLMAPTMRQEYTSLLVGTASANLYKDVSEAGKGDGGFRQDSLGFNQKPIKVSRHCPAGTIHFLSTKEWKLCELEAPGFSDLDGSILKSDSVGAAGTDNYSGYYRIYADVVCQRPNANAVLTGVEF